MEYTTATIRFPCDDKKYRSPDSSSTVLSVSSSYNPPPEMENLIHRYQQDISVQTSKIQQLKKTLQRYDKNLNRKSEPRLGSSIKQFLTENRQLQDQINCRENEVQDKIQQESSRLAKSIAASDQEAQQIEYSLEQLKQSHTALKSKLQEHKEAESLLLENNSLRKEIETLEGKIELYKTHGIRREDYHLLKIQIEDLKHSEKRLVKQNKELEEELHKTRRDNWERSQKTHSVQAVTSEINQIHHEVAALSKLVKSYQQQQTIDMTFFLDPPPETIETLTTLINKTKSEVQGLKTMLTDIYAEQIGNDCLNQ